jgi:hypothetical protein
MTMNLACLEGERDRYSDLKVLRSGAGFYLGTTYTGDDGFEEPGSRDSGYYATREEADAALRVLEALGDETAALTLRATPDS